MSVHISCQAAQRDHLPAATCASDVNRSDFSSSRECSAAFLPVSNAPDAPCVLSYHVRGHTVRSSVFFLLLSWMRFESSEVRICSDIVPSSSHAFQQCHQRSRDVFISPCWNLSLVITMRGLLFLFHASLPGCMPEVQGANIRPSRLSSSRAKVESLP